MRNTAIEHGALGCGISGSGPSIFSLCYRNDNAQNVAKAIKNVYTETGIPFEVYISEINTEGIKVIG